MFTHYDLSCKIVPKKGTLSVKGKVNIPEQQTKFLFVLNRGLRLKNMTQRIGDESQSANLYRTDEVEVPRFYNGDLWVVEASVEPHEPDQDQVVIDFEYSGQIHPPKKDSQMPVMGYIKSDFVELACYSAWYPVPLSMETYMSFHFTLEGPSDWTWDANGESSGSESSDGISIWTWNQNRQVNDITLVGMPLRDAHIDPESFFWGTKRMVGSQKVFDEHIHKLRGMLEDWLGPRVTDAPLRFVITPRQQGGAYARAGMVVVGGGYPTESSARNSVLQAMCHEICHDWFCKASPMTYDNWVDEALAEFCSIHIVNDYVNGEFLETRIKKTLNLLEESGDLPSIKSLVREKDESYAAFYYRGFLLLNEVANSVGVSEFRKLMRDFAAICNKSESITSDMFLELVQKKLGKDSRSIMEKWLDYSGKGTPG
ncbi:MAG: M1 family aminopeptidase [Candidatus Thorarchaeota archaeon]